MIINKEKKQLYILLACGVLALAVSIWAFRMEKSTGMMVSAEIEDRSLPSVQDDKYKAKQADGTLDTGAFAGTVIKKVDFDTKLEKMEDSVAQSMITTASENTRTELYMGEGTSADELLIVTVEDEDQMDQEIENVQKHLTDMRQSFQDYLPKEAKKIDDAVILQSGKYIVACVSGDKDTAGSVIREQLKGKK